MNIERKVLLIIMVFIILIAITQGLKNFVLDDDRSNLSRGFRNMCRCDPAPVPPTQGAAGGAVNNIQGGFVPTNNFKTRPKFKRPPKKLGPRLPKFKRLRPKKKKKSTKRVKSIPKKVLKFDIRAQTGKGVEYSKKYLGEPILETTGEQASIIVITNKNTYSWPPPPARKYTFDPDNLTIPLQFSLAPDEIPKSIELTHHNDFYVKNVYNMDDKKVNIDQNVFLENFNYKISRVNKGGIASNKVLKEVNGKQRINGLWRGKYTITLGDNI